MGVKALRKIQAGVESTMGTAVPATIQLRMTGTMEDGRTIVWPEESVGLFVGTDRAYTTSLSAKMDLEGDATFEHLPYVLNASINSDSDVAQDGAGTGYVRTYTMPTTAERAIYTYTLEGGDDTAVTEMEYSFVDSFTLSGKYQEPWKISSSWVGRQSSTCAFTSLAATALQTVEAALFGKTTLYIDDSTGTIGTTAKASTLLAADLSYKSGWIPKYTANGALYFDFIEQVGPEVSLNITFEHNATAVAELDAWRAGTGRLLRLDIAGSALTTTGTAYDAKHIIVDLSGKWEKFDKIDEIDGNDVVKGTLKCRWNADYGSLGSIVVVNELALLT